MNKTNVQVYKKCQKELYEYFKANKDEKIIISDLLEEYCNFFKKKKNQLKIYRYSPVDYYNIRNIETNTLFLSEAGKLNDIYEGLPRENLSDIGYEKINKIRDIAYVKSFSATWDDSSMWAYYGDAHTGMCVGYDLKLISDNDPILGHIFPVVYLEDRFVNAKIEDLIEENECLNAKKDDSNGEYDYCLQEIRSLFLSKGQSWEHEREWRIIYTKPELMKENSGGQVIVFPYISEIYVGFRIEDSKRKHISEIVRKHNENGENKIKLYQMMLSDKTYKPEAKRV